MGKRMVAINLSSFLSLSSRHLDSHFDHLSPKAVFITAFLLDWFYQKEREHDITS